MWKSADTTGTSRVALLSVRHLTMRITMVSDVAHRIFGRGSVGVKIGSTVRSVVAHFLLSLSPFALALTTLLLSFPQLTGRMPSGKASLTHTEELDGLHLRQSSLFHAFVQTFGEVLLGQNPNGYGRIRWKAACFCPGSTSRPIFLALRLMC